MKAFLKICALLLCAVIGLGTVSCSLADMDGIYAPDASNKDASPDYYPPTDGGADFDDGGSGSTDFGGDEPYPSPDDTADGTGDDMAMPEGSLEGSTDISDGGSEGGSEGGGSDKNGPIQKPAGLITAGAWNDNDNYALWDELFVQGENEGKFNFYLNGGWHFNSFNRIAVDVKTSDGTPVKGAYVEAVDGNGKCLYKAVSDTNGKAYLFGCKDAAYVSASSGAFSASVDITEESGDTATVTLDGAAQVHDVIDLMFVIDVTGSMGDELNYMKNELHDVISRVAKSNTGATVNLALLFYRDTTDREMIAYYDFLDCTKNENLASQLYALSLQYAGGGGDYPEAVDDALMLAMTKQWSTGATTKLIFHLLDAPPHAEEENREKYYNAVMLAAELGIRICPIICSGTNTLTEYLVREAAIHTGGTFIYITDDSGIGNPHHDPNLPNVVIEALNDMLVRLINGYHTGEFAPPVYWKSDMNA